MVWKQPVVNLGVLVLEDVAQVVMMNVAREEAVEPGVVAEAGRDEAVMSLTIDYLAFSFTTDFVLKGS